MAEGEQHNPATTAATATTTSRKPQRILACVLCQHRKVKCDRKFPCVNCQRANAQCIPAALVPRQRRRRFPERELLDRLRHYEDLLRKNKIDFEPMHASAPKPSANLTTMDEGSGDDSANETTTPANGVKDIGPEEVQHVAKNYWKAMLQKPQETAPNHESDEEGSSHDEMQEKNINKLFDAGFEGQEHLFFGSRATSLDLSTLHPEQSRIFKLWQIYLENVDPLLKITHTPSLQARIVDAAGNIGQIEPTLEALMFAIYCAAIYTLSDIECQTQFGYQTRDLLRTYQFGCQQALLNCSVSKTEDFEVLTALVLYMVSLKLTLDPRALFSLMGVAIRIAKRIGIHVEALNAKHNALAGEMRRRVWWVLTMYDDRMSEMSRYKDASLLPTWDCRTPSNLNDVDFHTDMKILPPPRTEPTESVFAVVRAEVGNFVRRSIFHLDFTNPILKAFMMDASHGPIRVAGELTELQTVIEEKYLKQCNPDIPLHFMTIWATRLSIARRFLQAQYSKYSSNPEKQSEEQQDLTLGYAMQMLEADTIVGLSPMCHRFTWYMHLYFPFPAYVHIIHDIKRRPGGKLVDKAWKVITNSYDVRFSDPKEEHGMFYRIFPKSLAAAWKARENFLKREGKQPQVPEMFASIELVSARMGLISMDADSSRSSATPQTPTDSSNVSPPSFFDTPDDSSMSSFHTFGMLPANYWNIPQTMEVDSSQSQPQFNWPATNWPTAPRYNW